MLFYKIIDGLPGPATLKAWKAVALGHVLEDDSEELALRERQAFSDGRLDSMAVGFEALQRLGLGHVGLGCRLRTARINIYTCSLA